jgi:hypothetical protein
VIQRSERIYFNEPEEIRHMCSLRVRAFRNGDEATIVELFNRVYEKYGGFVPRTVDYWLWCCIDRPDVQKEGIFLAFNEQELRGYLVAGSSGNIWEFCVANKDHTAAELLLNEAIKYLEKAGASSIDVNVPSDSGIASALQKVGFGELPAATMFVTTLNPAVLVQALAVPKTKSLSEKLESEEFGIKLTDVPFGVIREFSVKIHQGIVQVSEAFPIKPSAMVEFEFMDLLSVLLQKSSVSKLLLTRSMKVKPFWKTRAVLTLFTTISLKNPWFFPLGDLI